MAQQPSFSSTEPESPKDWQGPVTIIADGKPRTHWLTLRIGDKLPRTVASSMANQAESRRHGR